MDQINKKPQLSIRQRKGTLTKSANDDLKDFLGGSTGFQTDSRALSTQKSPTNIKPLPSISPPLENRLEDQAKPTMLNKSIDIPRGEDAYKFEDMSSFPQSRTHIYFRKSLEHEKRPQFLSKLNPLHQSDIHPDRVNLRRSGSFSKKKKQATVFLKEKGGYLERMNNHHLMTFLKKKISLKGGSNFEFQPHQERSHTGFMLTSRRMSPVNQVGSNRRELEQKLVLENRIKATEGSCFKVSRLNEPVVPLPPQVRENILSKNIKNHTFYFSDKWDHGMSEEREGFAELFDEMYEQGSFPERRSGLNSPYNRDNLMESELLESRLAHLIKQQSSIAQERCSSVFTNQTIKQRFTPVQEESETPQQVYGGYERNEKRAKFSARKKKLHSLSSKKLGLDLDMLIRQNIIDEHKRKLRTKTPPHRDHQISSELLKSRSRKDAMTTTSRPSADMKELSGMKSFGIQAESSQELARPSSQLSHILYSSPDERERLDMKELLRLPLKQGGGAKNVMGLMKKINKAQLAHSMAFNLKQNIRRNNLTKMNLYDKTDSFRTVGVIPRKGQNIIIPSSFFSSKYSRDQRSEERSLERSQKKVRDLVEIKHQEKELKVLQNQVLIEHFFEHESGEKQRNLAFNNLVKYFTSRVHKEGSREILKFLQDNEDLFLGDS